MSELLLEDYLSSEFKFGFELEAILEDGMSDDDAEEKLKKIFSDSFKFNTDDIDIKSDGSVKSNAFIEWKHNTMEDIMDDLRSNPENEHLSDEEIERLANMSFTDNYEDDYEDDLKQSYNITDSDFPFEWAVPVMQFTPSNILKCINALANLHKNGIYTNSTCGFHTHLSFPNISDKDCCWLISKLAIDEDMSESLLNFEGIKFYNEDYAGKDWLDELAGELYNNQFQRIKKFFTTSKYRNIRIHPQGTIEWRGPRDFLQSQNKALIAKYFKLVYTFVKWIAKTLDENEILGISKENYFKLVLGDDYDNSSIIDDFNKNAKSRSIEDKIIKAAKSNSYQFIVTILDKLPKSEKVLDVLYGLLAKTKSHKALLSNYVLKSFDYAFSIDASNQVKVNLYQLILASGLENDLVKHRIVSKKNFANMFSFLYSANSDICLGFAYYIFDGAIKYDDNTYFKELLASLKQTKIEDDFWKSLIYNKPQSIMYIYKIINPKCITKDYVGTIITHLLSDIAYNILNPPFLSLPEVKTLVKDSPKFRKEFENWLQTSLSDFIANNNDKKFIEKCINILNALKKELN